MENKNYTIKDIARLAGVSAGTVDRVLHNRGDVSAASREKVQKVLDEINYQPNMFAIGLAAKKPYRILCIIPYNKEHDYWHTVEQGIGRAAQEMQPFNVKVDYLHYNHADKESYMQTCLSLHEEPADGVLIAPNFEEETLRLTAALEERNLPYAFVDFNVDGAHALCYIGQDSRMSGYVAAKALMSRYRQGEELIFFLNNQKSSPAEIQMRRRLKGFMDYLGERNEQPTIHDVILQKEDSTENRRILDRFFAGHPHAVLGAVFNSRVYQVADYLRQTGRRLNVLVGYDLLPGNADHLRTGEVDFLIGQRPELQGYYGVKALCNHIVFKKPVPPIKYMPIDILMKENIDYYFEFE